MFNRRRASSNPPVKAPPSAAASLAASQAFLKGRTSNGSLSSAAAAAALRTHATSPTPVGDIQTKRMIRRGSTSSQGSGSNRGESGLRRQSSSGSMTERSFRDPSPNRSSPVVEADPNAPPVPSIPINVHRRASSLEPAHRGGSPAGRGGGRGVSLDRGMDGPTGRGQGRAAQKTGLAQVLEVERENSTRVTNFSRPMSPPESPSPKVASARVGHSGWFTAPVTTDQGFRDDSTRTTKPSNGLSSLDTTNVRQSVQNAADRPVSKNRLSQSVEGSRLSSGSMRAKPSGSAIQSHITGSGRAQPVDPKSDSAVYDPSTRTFISKQEAMARHRALHEGIERTASPPANRAPERMRSPPAQRSSQPVHDRAQHLSPERPQATTKILAPRTPSPQVLRSPERSESKVSYQPEDEANPSEYRPSEPLPGFQTRAGALLARQSSEKYGADDQEDTVEQTPGADTSRKMVSGPPPTTSEDNAPLSPQTVPSQDGPYPRLSKAASAPSSNLAPEKGRQVTRTPSLSPGRSAHFASGSVELTDGTKHHPPPRSVSPVKSALKHSPSSAVRHSSPMASSVSGVGRGAPSETSDAVSEDGSRGTPHKKKHVRVSFDDDAVVAGTSAYPEVQSPSSPPGLESSRWSPLTSKPTIEDIDDVMTPRPVLPSFGSIRGRSRRNEDDVPEKVTETVSSSMTTSIGSIGEPVEASSDHALGNIITQDFAAKESVPPTEKQSQTPLSNPLEPIPPEVTSVEGSGYYSESDYSDTAQDQAPVVKPAPQPTLDGHADRTVPQLEPKSLTQSVDVAKPQEVEVPSIALLPPTPKAEEERERPLSLPGSWDQYDEPEPERSAAKEEPVERDIEASVEHSQPHEQLSVLREQTDESDDNSSIYSDAMEDQSEDEDEGGYASIDAVVGSPVVSPPPGLAITTPPDSPIVALPPQTSAMSEPVQPKPQDLSHAPEDWDVVQQHWSALSETRKEEMEQEARSPAPVAPPQDVAAPVLQPVKQKTKKASTSAPRTKALVEAPSAKEPSPQPLKSALKKPTSPPPEALSAEPRLRKTMRGGRESQAPLERPPETQMRKSMRDSNTMRTSLRGDTGLAASRYSMPPPAAPQPKGALQKKNIPAAMSAPKARPQSVAGLPASSKSTGLAALGASQRNDSDDSVSSFRRQRPRTSGGEDGRYTMRASMRGASAGPTMRQAPAARPTSPVATKSPPPPAFRTSLRPTSPTPSRGGNKSSRFSIRSLSPNGRMLSKGGRTGSIDAAASSPKGISSKIPGLGKSPKSKPVAAPAKSASAPKFKSRFADSSDEEDEGRPTRFHSRFDDSDEEEDLDLPPGLTPVRGIPRKPGEEDRESTDLSDEASDGEAPASSNKDIEKANAPITNGNDKGQGAAFTAGSLRQSKHAPDGKTPAFQPVKKEKSKRGFFGLGKKKNTPASPIELPQTNGDTSIPLPPAQKTRETRVLSPIGEDKLPDPSTPPPAQPTQRSPKLQRRSMPSYQRSASDSWPLAQPPKIGGDEAARPQSSDGVGTVRPNASRRPSTLRTRFTGLQEGEGEDGEEMVATPVSSRTGKKKKFGRVRRMLGLFD